MEVFKLNLDDGGVLTGRLALPSKKPPTQFVPLLVCLHGGTYDSEYFDASPECSIGQISDALQVPVIAIDRPGYGEGHHHVPPATTEVTYAQQQGRYINTKLLPALWRKYQPKSGATSIVIMGHSVGAMMATVAVGSYVGTEGYPLAGIITSGIGAEHDPAVSANLKSMVKPGTQSLTFDPALKDAMTRPQGRHLADPAVTKSCARLNRPVPVGELMDINTTWSLYWHRYSKAVQVPLMYGLSEFDGLWTSTPEMVLKYRDSFPSSPRIECGIVPQAPRCIEHSYQSRGWLTRCVGFALECAVWYALKDSLIRRPVVDGEGV
ncbi:uncharacterized protein N7459_001767 [Penicillium hispanicum]|uniref:uncharacterized protein n=1 Tax=Penicillium hispanicum TaxID=1080232 RepID=UPI00253F9408|nr:uncharacterized protein N7459_001767 [Penicillium hispanicum]KAJ5595559.1 hypothetical protein N7459_001767 [Penicillium hispanicum]